MELERPSSALVVHGSSSVAPGPPPRVRWRPLATSGLLTTCALGAGVLIGYALRGAADACPAPFLVPVASPPPSAGSFCARSGEGCFSQRCCVSAGEYCYQQLNGSGFTASCMAYGSCGSDCTIVNPVMPYLTCIFESERIPCQYVYRDVHVTAGKGMYSGTAGESATTVLMELDIAKFGGGAFPTPGSTHEVALGPNGTAWLTQQNSDVISTLSIDRAAGCIEDVFSVVTHPLQPASEGGRALGVHQIIWPRYAHTAEPIAFLTLEFNNSIGVYNYETHQLLRLIEVPLECPRRTGIAIVTNASGAAGLSCGGGSAGWDCYSCIDRGVAPAHPSFTTNCSMGARPHMLAEAADGSIWVALKTGALARLRLSHWSAEPQ
eukprot:5059042-Prymnesium_polylepis.1